jgi:hypothetical protein
VIIHHKPQFATRFVHVPNGHHKWWAVGTLNADNPNMEIGEELFPFVFGHL